MNIRHWLHTLFLAPVLLQADEAPRPLMRDFIGINGHTVQFKPDLYQPIARLVRDYHPVAWDLGNETSTLPPFPFAKNKVDWSKVYGSWREKGWTTNACLMFESVPIGDWKNLETDARNYGEAFAREFGPGGKRVLVETVEIGNEPGKWSDADYSRIFRSMAQGIHKGDPGLRIATCNLTAGESGSYEKSAECIRAFPALVDVLTIHSYAQLTGWPTWKRSFPEDPALPKYLKDIEDLCAWRDRHMPGKPVWITEFGYDSTTKPQEKSGTFAKWEGVTDEQQAQWLVRSLLVFSSMPVERAYIYFFNDEDKPSVHASSGLTRHFKPKPSFHAAAHLRRVLGDFRFQRVVTNEPGKLRVQEYKSPKLPNRTIWVAWSPTEQGKPYKHTFDRVPGKLLSSSRMPLNGTESHAEPASRSEAGIVRLIVRGSPAYLVFENQP